MVDLTSINARIAEFDQLRAALVAEIKVDFGKVVKDVLIEHDFPLIVITAYTPGFNDGDPCEHSQSCGLEDYEIEDLIEKFENEDGGVTVEKIKLALERNAYGYKGVEYERSFAVRCVFNNLEEVLHHAFGTNWQIMAAFDDAGNFHYHFNEDYDCGY